MEEKVENTDFNKMEDTLELEFDNSVNIICPECNKHVTIGADNICPNCGCEFEEIEKKFRLTKLGVCLCLIMSVTYFFTLSIIKLVIKPDNEMADESLFYMDAFRIFDFKIFIAMILICLAVFAVALALNYMDQSYKKIILSGISVVLSFIGVLLFIYTQRHCMYYFVIQIVFCMPLGQLAGSVMCFADAFILPKSKFNEDDNRKES